MKFGMAMLERMISIMVADLNVGHFWITDASAAPYNTTHSAICIRQYIHQAQVNFSVRVSNVHKAKYNKMLST